MVRRSLVALVLLCPLLWTLAAPTRAAEEIDVASALADRSMGAGNAPVTIIEYSSLTCPHCADFHRETLPQIKAEYIDRGKVRYILREFPTGPAALSIAATMIARCVDPARYFGFMEILYAEQRAWMGSKDPIGELKVRAQTAGLSPAGVDACLKNETILNSVQQRAFQGQKEYGVDSTPTFIINGTKLSGAQPYAEFKKAIDDALAKR